MDLETYAGYVAFLRLQEAGLTAVFDAVSRADVTEMCDDLLERLRFDLARLGADTVAVMSPPPGLHPLAVTYVLSGSRLGSSVLRQRWENGALAQSGLPAAYMKAPEYLEIWRAFCSEARNLPATGAVADQIVSDAIKVFQVFQAAALAAFEKE